MVANTLFNSLCANRTGDPREAKNDDTPRCNVTDRHPLYISSFLSSCAFSRSTHPASTSNTAFVSLTVLRCHPLTMWTPHSFFAPQLIACLCRSRLPFFLFLPRLALCQTDTCRGTCQCSTSTYHGPGSHGYEVQDAQYMADAGADYVKEVGEAASRDLSLCGISTPRSISIRHKSQSPSCTSSVFAPFHTHLGFR